MITTKVAICIGIRNRSKQLLSIFLPSLNKCVNRNIIALSIVDCHSDDIPNLKVEIEKIWKGTLYYTKSEKPFTRSSSTNDAVKQCKEEKVFLCDADMQLPANFMQLVTDRIKSNMTWFPICFSLLVNRPAVINKSNGRWRKLGFGMCGVWKSKFLKMGGYNETFKSWGGEDTHFYKSSTGTIIRTNCEGLFHHWHPDDMDYKNKWYNT